MGNSLSEELARNLRHPTKSMIGRYIEHVMVKKNTILEKEAVRLCNIQPDHKVLEIGFGPGIGLASACERVKGGNGKIYGLEISAYMLQSASKRLRQQITDKKLELMHGSVAVIPFPSDHFDSVFHTNCYYFWPNMRKSCIELHRVMKPGGLMVATLNMSSLKKRVASGGMKYGNIDPIAYMHALEHAGFCDVHMQYQKTDDGFEYQCILSTAASESFSEQLLKRVSNEEVAT